MKYLCLVYYDERQLSAMPENERRRFRAQCAACRESLKHGGRQLAGEALEAGGSTLRFLGKDQPLIHGSLPDSGHTRLGAFFLIAARDLNEAVRLASGLPAAQIGHVEIRPVRT